MVASNDGTARRTGSMPDPAVLSFMTSRVKNQPHNTAFSVYEEGFWRSMSYAEIRHRSKVLSSWLIEQSLQHGSRIAVLSESNRNGGSHFLRLSALVA